MSVNIPALEDGGRRFSDQVLSLLATPGSDSRKALRPFFLRFCYSDWRYRYTGLPSAVWFGGHSRRYVTPGLRERVRTLQKNAVLQQEARLRGHTDLLSVPADSGNPNNVTLASAEAALTLCLAPIPPSIGMQGTVWCGRSPLVLLDREAVRPLVGHVDPDVTAAEDLATRGIVHQSGEANQCIEEIILDMAAYGDYGVVVVPVMRLGQMLGALYVVVGARAFGKKESEQDMLAPNHQRAPVLTHVLGVLNEQAESIVEGFLASAYRRHFHDAAVDRARQALDSRASGGGGRREPLFDELSMALVRGACYGLPVLAARLWGRFDDVEPKWHMVHGLEHKEDGKLTVIPWALFGDESKHHSEAFAALLTGADGHGTWDAVSIARSGEARALVEGTERVVGASAKDEYAGLRPPQDGVLVPHDGKAVLLVPFRAPSKLFRTTDYVLELWFIGHNHAGMPWALEVAGLLDETIEDIEHEVVRTLGFELSDRRMGQAEHCLGCVSRIGLPAVAKESPEVPDNPESSAYRAMRRAAFDWVGAGAYLSADSEEGRGELLDVAGKGEWMLAADAPLNVWLLTELLNRNEYSQFAAANPSARSCEPSSFKLRPAYADETVWHRALHLNQDLLTQLAAKRDFMRKLVQDGKRARDQLAGYTRNVSGALASIVWSMRGGVFAGRQDACEALIKSERLPSVVPRCAPSDALRCTVVELLQKLADSPSEAQVEAWWHAGEAAGVSEPPNVYMPVSQVVDAIGAIYCELHPPRSMAATWRACAELNSAWSLELVLEGLVPAERQGFGPGDGGVSRALGRLEGWCRWHPPVRLDGDAPEGFTKVQDRLEFWLPKTDTVVNSRSADPTRPVLVLRSKPCAEE